MSADADGLPADPLPDDGPPGDAPEPAGPEAPATEAGAASGTFGRIEALELAGVFLIACVQPFALSTAPHESGYTLAHLVSAAAVFGGMSMLFWALLLRDPTWAPPLPRGRGWLSEIALGFLLAWGVWSLESVLARVLDGIGVHAAPSYGAAALRAIAQDPALRSVRAFEMFTAVAVEEVIFRAYLMHRMGQLVGRTSWMVVWVPALLFAVKHGYTLHGTAVVLLFGLVFGYVYRRTHRLPRLVFAHWAHNMTLMSFYT